MGIYIRMHFPWKYSGRIIAISRLEIAERIINYLEKYNLFKIDNIKIWNEAPSESFGGNIITTLNNFNSRIDFEKLSFIIDNEFYQKYYSSIIMFEGKWKIEDKLLDGYISVNNYWLWRSIYYDIEIDAYKSEDIDDIVQILYHTEYFKETTLDFINYLSEYPTKIADVKIDSIFYSIGVPDAEDIENIIVHHTQTRSSFIRFLYSRLRKEDDKWIEEHIVPISKSFYLSEINKNKITEVKFNQFTQEMGLISVPGGSITYIASERNSFINFYNRFKEEIFKPTALKLPNASTLRKMIQAGLDKLGKLNEYL